MKTKTDPIPTISLEDVHKPLDIEPVLAKRQIMNYLTTDDLESFSISEDQIVCLYLNTIIDEKRFHEEIASFLPDIIESTENWPKLFPTGKSVASLDQAISDLLHGSVLILHVNLQGSAISIPLKHIKLRSITEPKLERIVVGPKESFIENIQTNIGLLRRWVKDPNLAIRYYQAGQRSKTRIAVCFMRDIANPDWVKEIETAISKIDIDIITAHKDLLDLIIGRNQTPFPLYQLTEIPARCQAEMVNGRIILFVDGAPYAILLPSPLLSMFREAEYLLHSGVIQVFVRGLRILAAFISMYAAAFYVALVSVNTSIIPVHFNMTIAMDQRALPYSNLVEVLVMLIVLDIFIEGTTYVPGDIGSALNIVGSLIIGQMAAQAGIISSMMVIVSSITGIGTYLSSYQLSYAIRLWKYLFVLSAAVFGIYGIVTCMVVQLAHLSGLKSLGVPYLSPLGPFRWNEIVNGGLVDRDTGTIQKRSRLFSPMDRTKQKGDPNE